MGELMFSGAIHITEQSKIDAARLTQASGNEVRGSNAALQQFSASLGNKRRMEAAGAAANDVSGNVARLKASLTAGTMNERIRASEELGAVAAMAGAAGIGGSSVEVYNETLRLHNAIREQAVEASVGDQVWASEQQRANVLKSAVAGMDNNTYRANIDYTKYVDHNKMGFLEKTIGIAAVVGATVVAGPQAGAAVLSLVEARQQASNGDFASASASMSSAVKSGYAAASSYNATHSPEAAPAAPAASTYTAPTAEDYRPFFSNPVPNYNSVTLR